MHALGRSRIARHSSRRSGPTVAASTRSLPRDLPQRSTVQQTRSARPPQPFSPGPDRFQGCRQGGAGNVPRPDSTVGIEVPRPMIRFGGVESDTFRARGRRERWCSGGEQLPRSVGTGKLQYGGAR
jgi:hypothetical protein